MNDPCALRSEPLDRVRVRGEPGERADLEEGHPERGAVGDAPDACLDVDDVRVVRGEREWSRRDVVVLVIGENRGRRVDGARARARV